MAAPEATCWFRRNGTFVGGGVGARRAVVVDRVLPIGSAFSGCMSVAKLWRKRPAGEGQIEIPVSVKQ